MQTAQSTLIRQPEVARIKLPERNGDPEKNLCPSIGPRLASKRSGLGVNARADLSMLEPFLVNVENDGEQDATDFRLDVDFPVAFLDESGHVLRVSSIQPGVARFRITNTDRGIGHSYPGDQTPADLISFYYAIRGKIKHEKP